LDEIVLIVVVFVDVLGWLVKWVTSMLLFLTFWCGGRFTLIDLQLHKTQNTLQLYSIIMYDVL